MKSNVLITIAGLLSFLSSAAIADTSVAEQHSLEKMIQEKTEHQLAAEDKKYAQLSALAGDRQDELAKSKNEVTNTYNKWHDLKTAIETFPNKANHNDFKAVEVAAQAYSEANKAFITLQKDILIKAKIPSKDQATYLVDGRVIAPAVSRENSEMVNHTQKDGVKQDTQNIRTDKKDIAKDTQDVRQDKLKKQQDTHKRNRYRRELSKEKRKDDAAGVSKKRQEVLGKDKTIIRKNNHDLSKNKRKKRSQQEENS